MARLPDHLEMRRHPASDKQGHVAYRLRLHLAAVTMPCHDHDLDSLVDDHEYPLERHGGDLAVDAGWRQRFVAPREEVTLDDDAFRPRWVMGAPG